MNKRTFFAVILVVVLVITPAVVYYGYSNFSNVIEPQKKPLSVEQFVVVKVPTTPPRYFTLTAKEYFNLTLHGVKFPNGTLYYVINVESYLTGDPLVDVNLTLRNPKYNSATIIVGDVSFRNCKGKEDKTCILRIRTAMELGAVVGAVFGVKYYLWEVLKNEDNQSAAYKAAEETAKRVDSGYLAFFPKVKIGLGLIGNEEHLLIILRGPKEGGEKNRIYCPKEGVLVLEANNEYTLFAEVLVLKNIISSQVR